MTKNLHRVINKRCYQERAVPKTQRGLLEKKRDYCIRRDDYQEKQSQIKTFKEKAFFANPEEYNTRMVNTRIVKNRILDLKDMNIVDPKFQKEVERATGRDALFVNMKRSQLQAKNEKFGKDLHFTSQASMTDDGDRKNILGRHVVFDNSDDSSEEVVEQPKKIALQPGRLDNAALHLSSLTARKSHKNHRKANIQGVDTVEKMKDALGTQLHQYRSMKDTMEKLDRVSFASNALETKQTLMRMRKKGVRTQKIEKEDGSICYKFTGIRQR